MLYKEMYSFPDGIFSDIIGYTYENKELNIIINPSMLDTYFYSKYSCRTMIDMIANNVDSKTGELSDFCKLTLSNLFENVYFARWDRIIKDLLLQYNPTDTVDYTETVNGTDKGTSNTNNKNYGYDSVNGVNADSSENSTTGENNTVRTVKGRQSSNTYFSIINDVKLANEKLLEYITKDVAEMLTIPYYESED